MAFSGRCQDLMWKAQHIVGEKGKRKIQVACQSQFFDFTKLFSSLQTQVISFLAFKFSPIIAEYKSEVIDSTYTIYGISRKKSRTSIDLLYHLKGVSSKPPYILIVIPVMFFSKSNLIIPQCGTREISSL